MIPSWLVIGGVTILVAFAFNRLSARDRQWFNRLRRPRWLTFERAIPAIWSLIFICGAWSAYLVWEENPGSLQTWLLMGGYLLVEVVIVAYTPLMCKLRSLRVGTAVGATGFVFGAILALLVLPVSGWAAMLLVPYLLWSPVGTYVTWQMGRINPSQQ